MSQTFEWSADSEVIDYYSDIVLSQDPYLSMVNQFDLVSVIDDPENYLIKIEEKPVTVKPVQSLNEYELIEIPGKPKNAASIRKAYHRMNLDPELKAMEKGPDYVRAYYNDKNLRRRLK